MVGIRRLFDVTGHRYPPLEGSMSQPRGLSFGTERVVAADHPLRNSVGAIG